jgi:hypothetical protein
MKITIKELQKLVKEEVVKQLKEGDILTFSSPKDVAIHIKRIAEKYYHDEVEIDKPNPTMRMYKNEPDSYKEDLKMWKEDEKMYADDRKDLYTIADLIVAKNYKAAVKKIDNLDTMVREMIPRSVHRFLKKQGVEPDMTYD